MSLFEEIASLPTEVISSEFENIDLLPTSEILAMINTQDKLVADAVSREIPYIEKAVDAVVTAFHNNGRLIYVGAGTSGRLGVLDASECPPTFGSNPEMVQGIIAGGKEAAFKAIEGAEDIAEDGIKAIQTLQVCQRDVVCGISASGRTPFVLAAINQAKIQGAFTIFISTNPKVRNNSNISAALFICPDVGPEVIAGSTRMKSGTAQKMVLNMLTTTTFVQIGKTYKNIMVDLQPTNQKLIERSKRIVMEIADVGLKEAEDVLKKTNYNVRESLIMLLCKVTQVQAREILNLKNGKIREAILTNCNNENKQLDK